MPLKWVVAHEPRLPSVAVECCQRCLQVCLLLRRPDSPAALKMRLAELLVVTLSHLMSGDASHGPSSQLVPQTGDFN